MAEFHGSLTRVYARGYDFSTLFTDTEQGREHRIVDATGFGRDADRHIVDPSSGGKLTASGMLDADLDTGAHDALARINAGFDDLGGDTVAVTMLRDTTIGDPGFVVVGSIPDPTLQAARSDIVKTSFNARANRAAWVRALHPKGAQTVAGNGSALDHGASTALGGLSTLQVFALTGTTPVIRIKAQDSPDGSTWTDLATHTDITAAGVTAGYGEAVAASGLVDRRLRWILSVVSGSLTSITFAHQFARYTPRTLTP